MQSGVFFLQHVVIVLLQILLLDPTLDVFVLSTRCKRGVGIVFVGLTAGNHECYITRAQQCNRSAEGQCRGMFASASERLAMVETPSLRCFERVRGRETRSSF